MQSLSRNQSATGFTGPLSRATGARTEAFRIEQKPEHRLVALDDDRSIGAEKFCMLGHRLKLQRKLRKLRSVSVTSSIVDEGKSLISANLAITMARHGRERILLIDGDVQRGRLSTVLNSPPSEGLAGWHRTGGTIEQLTRQVQGLPLWFLPTGARAADTHFCLKPDRVKALLEIGEEMFDWVIVECPPVTVVADALIWAAASDGTLLVVRQGATPKRMLKKALACLEESKLLGAVLNDCEDAAQSYYSQYYLKRAPKR
ncbi:MAG: CpsD/CapB family tyrosine-protein kinase [Acidobacteriaceae bacterium]